MDTVLLNKKYPEAKSVHDYIKYTEIRQMSDNINHFYLKNFNHPISISIHSLLPEEGKTFLAVSLGVALTNYFNKKILIVDTIDDNQFLKSIKQVDEDDDSIINHSFFKDLDIVHLSKLKIHEYQIDSILSGFADEYDVIFFDTIPLSLKNVNNIDPFAIAKRCDHRFLVVSKKSAGNQSLSKVKSDFKKSDLGLSGVIYNEMEIKK